jgi:HEAT repeat protein
VTPANRWKLVSLVLAGCLSYTWWHGEAASNTPDGRRSHARVDGQPRFSAATLGMSKDELVRRLFASKDLDEIRELAARLGNVGDDQAIDDVMPLLADAREGVPEAVIGAIGGIATEHAIEVLTDLTRDSREEVRTSAIDALAATASDRAIDALAKIASHPGDNGAHAMRAIARIEKPAARAVILRFVDSPSVAIAATAIGELAPDELDANMVAKLADIVTAGDRTLVDAALGALAKAGDAGFPTLRQAALAGTMDVRVVAIHTLGNIDNPQVVEMLRSILEDEQGRAADAAAGALAGIDSDEAREALISAALADESGSTRALEYLMQQTGPEVEQALLVIARSESSERLDAVAHLVRAGNADALALAIAEARSGDDDRRVAAMELLAESGTEPARDALFELVQQSGELKGKAIAILSEAAPDDPAVAKLLHESLQSRDPDEAAAAASALAAVGTEEARASLVAALGNSDASVVGSAASSLAHFRLTDEVTAALRSAAATHPELKTQVMSQLVTGGSPLGLELAKQTLHGDSPDDAYRALQALEQAGTPGAVELIVEAARVSDPQVRAQAVSTFGNIGDKRGVELAGQALRDPEPNVRYAAARTLGAMGTANARDQLITLTRSADEDDRRAAVNNLRRFDDGEATRRLVEMARDPNPAVSYSAVDAIADRANPLEALRGYLGDPGIPRDVRRQAATALSYRGITDPLLEQLLEADPE